MYWFRERERLCVGFCDILTSFCLPLSLVDVLSATHSKCSLEIRFVGCSPSLHAHTYRHTYTHTHTHTHTHAHVCICVYVCSRTAISLAKPRDAIVGGVRTTVRSGVPLELRKL